MCLPGTKRPVLPAVLDEFTQSITERWKSRTDNLYRPWKFPLSLLNPSVPLADVQAWQAAWILALADTCKREFKSGGVERKRERDTRRGQSNRGVTAALVTGLSRENAYRESPTHVHVARPVHRACIGGCSEADRLRTRRRLERAGAKCGP